MSSEDLIKKIDALLPQTQCTKCGYEGCLPYAEAIAFNNEEINRCPPGGQEGIEKLAHLLNRPVIPLNEECGTTLALQVALIDEEHCIGCTLCIKACPVDAIVGANKFMHTVIEDLCTGCDLCVAPCPVDCITMVDANREWTTTDANQARQRHYQRNQRLIRIEKQEEERLNRLSINTNKANTKSTKQNIEQGSSEENKKQAIADALARARARRQNK